MASEARLSRHRLGDGGTPLWDNAMDMVAARNLGVSLRLQATRFGEKRRCAREFAGTAFGVGEKVILDSDLAALYGVETRALNQSVARNHNRFPDDFMFQLSSKEFGNVSSHRVSVSTLARPDSSQFVMSSMRHRGRSYRPYAFTEQGVAMLSSVLRSVRAAEVNIAIMRTFVQLRRLMDANRDLARKIEALESTYDEKFASVFKVIKQLVTPPEPQKRRIGFHES